MAGLKPGALHLVLLLGHLLGTEPAILHFKSLPKGCFTETARLMCEKFFPKALSPCLEAAEPSDYIIVNRSKLCYVGYPDRCLSAEFCPEAMKEDLPKPIQTSEDNSQPEPGLDQQHGRTPLDHNTQDDAFNLLSAIGQYIFWTQLGVGLFIFCCLLCAMGILFWYRAQLKRLQLSTQGNNTQDQEQGNTQDQEQGHKKDQEQGNTQDTAGEPVSEPSLAKPLSKPPPNLNDAWDNDSESLYDNPPAANNPFTGWEACSSFKPLGSSRAVSESIPLTYRPMANTDRSPMTNATQEALSTLERNALHSKQGKLGRAKWTESTEQLQKVQEEILSATLSHLEQAGYYTRPSGHLPPHTPIRTSSLRGPSSSRRNRRNKQERSNVYRSDERLQNDQPSA